MTGKGPQYLLAGVASAAYRVTNFGAGPGVCLSVRQLLAVDRPLRINAWTIFTTAADCVAMLYVVPEGLDPVAAFVPHQFRVAGWMNGTAGYGAGCVTGSGVRVLPDQGLLGVYTGAALDPASTCEMTVLFDLEES